MSVSKPVTLEDVASYCGFSRATVSRVANGADSVDPEIAKQVRAAIKATGYVQNRAARALAGSSSQNIGLVFSEGFREIFQNPFWGEIIEGITSVLGSQGYQETFLNRSKSSGADIETYLLQRHVDGVIFLNSNVRDTLIPHLESAGLPTVVFGSHSAGGNISTVTLDDREVGRIAANRLLSGGRRNPVAIVGPAGLRVSRQRISGFTEGLAAKGVEFTEDRVAQGDFTFAGGRKAMLQLLAAHPMLDAVFASSDPMAMGALDALVSSSVAVPGQVAVIGVDGTSFGELARPRLTSIEGPNFEMGQNLAQLILDAINGKAHRSVVYAPRLVERESA